MMIQLPPLAEQLFYAAFALSAVGYLIGSAALECKWHNRFCLLLILVILLIVAMMLICWFLGV